MYHTKVILNCFFDLFELGAIHTLADYKGRTQVLIYFCVIIPKCFKYVIVNNSFSPAARL